MTCGLGKRNIGIVSYIQLNFLKLFYFDLIFKLYFICIVNFLFNSDNNYLN